MTVTVTIEVSGETSRSETMVVSDEALAAVRFNFNPSQLAEVVWLKALAAALWQKAYEAGDSSSSTIPESTEACRLVQSASMWAVAAATEGL